MHSNIAEQTATGSEIESIVSMIEPVIVGIPRGKSIIALLSMTLVLMHPAITPAKLQSGVQDVSRFICLLLDDNEGEPEIMN